ncbi:MAG TPA: hypothetical protein VH138_04605 [Vicinamibacterales bacterium]|nr:hypothetical protein [Vicinamibacterales bacterium]
MPTSLRDMGVSLLAVVNRLTSLERWQRGDASAPRFDDDERMSEAVAKLPNDADNRVTNATPRPRWKPDQNDSGAFPAACVREYPKVLVFGQQHSPLGVSKRQDGWICCASIDFGDSRHVITGCAQSHDDSRVAALIREKTHCLVPTRDAGLVEEHDFFVREGVGRVSHRCLNILARELRIRVQEIRVGRTFTQFPKQQFHGNPRAANDRFTQHHVRIDLDAISESHQISQYFRIANRVSTF